VRFFANLFCHDSLENVAGIDAFKVVFLLAAKQRNLRTIYSKFAHFSCYQLISEHFG